jgi:hypothetical protein
MGSEFDTAKGSQPIVRRPGAKRSPALPQNRQWAEFLRSLATTASEPDPLLPKALKFHPRLHMDIRSEDDRLALLHAQCLRLCCGDHTRAKRLAADVIWAGPPPEREWAK